MNVRSLFAAIVVFVLWAANVSAYEVWMGTHLMRHSDATNLVAWSTVAPLLEGVNINRAPNTNAPPDDPPTNNEWRTIFDQFSGARQTMTEFARSQATRNPAFTNDLAFPSIQTRLEEIFSNANTFEYELTILMFYDENGSFQGTNYLYEWTIPEVQFMRDWLDTNGHANVELMWNVRNNAQRNRDFAAHPLVDHVEIEASSTALLDNSNNQITFARWFWTNSATINKRLAFQIPRVLPGDPLNQYQGTRRVLKMLGDEFGYGTNGVRSSRLVMLPVTYGDNYLYLPETTSGGTAYNNRLTSICLSLIEQRSLFEGRTRLPTNADADSTTRLFPPTASPIPNQFVSVNASTGPLAFIVGDDATPAGSLTLIKSSSNTNLVPLANVVFSGSGSNRTVTVTPAAGQTGSALIAILVSDGTLGTPVNFNLTVSPPGTAMGVLYSEFADSTPRKVDGSSPSILAGDASNANVFAGRSGTGGSVERCMVFLFQLPALGNIANPFTAASLSFNLVLNDFAPTNCNLDLYGLSNRASATVLATDFYSETDVIDPTPGTTRLQNNICTKNSAPGLYTNNASGGTALINFLNAQYAGGANAGKYVFLRLNKDAVVGTSTKQYLVTAADGAATNSAGFPNYSIWPQIAYTAAANTPPTISAIADQSIVANSNTGPLAFTVGDDLTAASSLTLNKLSSNTNLVPLANIVFGGSGASRTVTVMPTSGQSGNAVISIIVSDGSLSATNTFTLTVLPPGAIISTLYADLADSAPRREDGQPPSILTSTASEATLYAGRGGSGGSVDRCVVFPFQLPVLGMKTNPFTAASLVFNLLSNDFAPTNCNLDLYGLSNRTAATVLASDYYSETDAADPTPGTTRLQDNICTPASTAGNYTNNPTGSTALLNYLNAQYVGGTNAGKFVFLRLSKDALVGTSIRRYTVMSANGASTNNAGLPDYTVWPRIQFTAVAAQPTGPAVVTPSLSNGMIGLAISSDPAFNYTVQASTNMVDWINLLVTNSPALPFNWTDTNAGSFVKRFYRVLIGP